MVVEKPSRTTTGDKCRGRKGDGRTEGGDFVSDSEARVKVGDSIPEGCR